MARRGPICCAGPCSVVGRHTMLRSRSVPCGIDTRPGFPRGKDNMAQQTYTDLPIGERAAFELVCARHGFTPVHFEISGGIDPSDDAHGRLVTIRRGGWRSRIGPAPPASGYASSRPISTAVFQIDDCLIAPACHANPFRPSPSFTPTRRQRGGEDVTQQLVRRTRRQITADRDPRQRAHQQRQQHRPVDRAEQPVTGSRQQGQRHGMGDIGADDACRRQGGVQQQQHRHADGPPRPLTSATPERPAPRPSAPSGRQCGRWWCLETAPVGGVRPGWPARAGIPAPTAVISSATPSTA